MGNLTAKTSGELASFMSPSMTNIKSLKVHFSPKQLGTGDPSPENVREIVGWDGVEVNGCGKNLLQNADGKISSLKLKKGIVITASSDEGGYFRGKKNGEWVTPIVWLNKTAKNGRKYTEPYTLPEDIDEGCIFLGTGVSKAQITLDGNIDYKPYQGNNISYQLKLPDEYQEVEYIESTGTQYIDLPFGFDKTDEIETRFTVLKGDVSYVSDKYIVSPNRWNDNNNRFAMGIHSSGGTNNNQYCVGFGQRSTANTYLQPRTTSDFLMHTWEYKNGVFRIDELGLSEDVSSITFGGTTYPLRLFYGYNSNTIGRIAYYKHKKTNGDLYNFIPCYRKSDNEIGMYDTMSQTFYTNSGTGTFLKGDDVNKTFYGGYVDLISGELVETNIAETFTSTKTDTTSYDAEDSIYFGLTPSYPFVSIYSSGAIVSTNGVGTAPRNGLCNRLKIDYIDNWRGIQYINSLCSQYTLGGFAIRMSKNIFNLEDGYNGQAKKNAINEYLSENPIVVYYELKIPITHQLTPTQLKSFVGQNNFWSNADYVEIEYDLIETIDIQKAKQKIILNQPQLKTISDKVVSFNTDMVAPMKNCKIYFNPIQLGTGDASPTNVRNINGWTSIDSYVNGDKINVDWTSDAGTVYGGYLDLAKGEVVAEKDCITSYNGETLTGEWISDRDIYTVGNTPTIGAKVVYILSEPIHYPLSSLTSQQFLTLKSTNHIWSETNGQQIDVKYWTHKNLTPVPLTNYLENQTWTDSAYISSNGKKTVNGTSASHFLTNQILLEAGTYVLSGFSHYVGTDNTNYRIHAYDSTGKWLRQITYKQIGNLSPVDISFTLDTDTYVNVSIAMDFDGVLAKIN